MTDIRVIKKYPNRRLYDTELSRYITLADLRNLIMSGGEFEVRDANSNEDITRNILLQIIAEQESEGTPLFTTEMLLQMIRFYGEASQDTFTRFLGNSLDLFVKQQALYKERMQDAMSGNPMSAMADLTQRNLEIWKEMQDGFFKSAGMGPGRKSSDSGNNSNDT